MTDAEARVLKLYSAFNGPDYDVVLDLLAEDIDWPDEASGARLSSKTAVRASMLEHAATHRAEYAPIAVQEHGDGRVTVLAQRVSLDAIDGSLRSNTRVRHVFQLREGLIVRMDAEQSVNAALDGDVQRLLAALHDAIGRHDIDGVMASFHPNARMPDSLEHVDLVGLPAIRAYYLRQFEAIQVAASVTDLKPLGDERFEAIVDVMVRGPGGGFWWQGPVTTHYRIQDGLIIEMEIDDNPPAGAP